LNKMKMKFRTFRALLTGLLLVMAAAVLFVPETRAANDTATGLPVRTSQEEAEMWQKLMHPKSDIDAAFAVAPKTTAPYAPGTLRSDYLQDGVNAVNFYRFISGLPADIRTTDELNKKAAYGSLLGNAETSNVVSFADTSSHWARHTIT